MIPISYQLLGLQYFFLCVQYNLKGDEIIIDIIQKDDLFGSINLDGDVMNEFAVALSTESIVCSFRITDFENILTKNPDIALKYFKLMGLKLKKIENKYTNLVFKDVRSRLISFLKDWINTEGHRVGFDWVRIEWFDRWLVLVASWSAWLVS
jgi:CRP/FNR family transcriptional regulator